MNKNAKYELFGHPVDTDDLPLRLREVSIVAKKKALRKLRDHLTYVIDHYDEINDHIHWNPKCGEDELDIVICKPHK